MTLTEDQLMLIGRVAHSVASKWPDTHAGDLRNELVCQWLNMRDKNVTWDGYWEMETEEGTNKLNAALVRFANKWCRAETKAIRGNDDYAQYSRHALKQMLPLLHHPESWGSLAVMGAGGKSSKPAREGGDALASYADLTRAYDMLTDDDRWLLNVRFVFECVDWLAQTQFRFDCTEQAARNRTSRALDHLERNLAGRPYIEGPVFERRMVFSNARAQSELRHQYDG